MADQAEAHSQEGHNRADRTLLHREASHQVGRNHHRRAAARRAEHIRQRDCREVVRRGERSREGSRAAARQEAIPVAAPNLREAVRQEAARRAAIQAADPNLREEHRQADRPEADSRHRVAIQAADRNHHRQEARRAADPNLQEDHRQVDNRHRPIRAPSRSASARSP